MILVINDCITSGYLAKAFQLSAFLCQFKKLQSSKYVDLDSQVESRIHVNVSCAIDYVVNLIYYDLSVFII